MWLSRLRGIMSVSQFEGERALESVTAPIYRFERTQADSVTENTSTIHTLEKKNNGSETTAVYPAVLLAFRFNDMLEYS